MFSYYPTGNRHYASPGCIDTASRPPRYRIVATTDHGSVELLRCNPHEEFVREFAAAVGGSAPRAHEGVGGARRVRERVSAPCAPSRLKVN